MGHRVSFFSQGGDVVVDMIGAKCVGYGIMTVPLTVGLCPRGGGATSVEWGGTDGEERNVSQ